VVEDEENMRMLVNQDRRMELEDLLGLITLTVAVMELAVL
jgi:hypothetical protein